MKVERLLEIISVSNQERTVSGRFNSKDWEEEDDENARQRGRGVGRFSTVKPGSDPHTVKKSSKSPNHDMIDGYWRFIDYVARYQLWENPHFPRVYNIKKIKDQSGDMMLRGEIEKLESLEDLRMDEIKHLYQKIYGLENMPSLGQNTKGLGRSEVKDLYLKRLATDVQHSVKGLGNQKIEEESFKNAVKILKMIKKRESTSKDKIRSLGFIYDIHYGNIMARRTPYGLQLVFTDPFV